MRAPGPGLPNPPRIQGPSQNSCCSLSLTASQIHLPWPRAQASSHPALFMPLPQRHALPESSSRANLHSATEVPPHPTDDSSPRSPLPHIQLPLPLPP